MKKDIDFIEQAELLQENEFLEQFASHPDESNILRKLLGPGAKLLIGPRGSGKSTLLLKAYYDTVRNKNAEILPIYVNFKHSLSLEPLYKKDIQASFIFKKWLILNTIYELNKSLELQDKQLFDDQVIVSNLYKIITNLKLNNFDEAEKQIQDLELPTLEEILNDCIERFKYKRVIILMDDAAHAFSIEQQHDFFEFFRSLRSRTVSPKAAIYPGVTSYPPTFHVGHDAEEVSIWIDPFDSKYTKYMKDILLKRAPSSLHQEIHDNEEKINFFAYASFGIPRAFLGMFFDHIKSKGKNVSIDLSVNQIFKTNKKWFERNYKIFESLMSKIPRYSEFIKFGKKALNEIVSLIKEYNRTQTITKQSVIIAIKKPIPQELQKVIQFYQYSGLVLPKDKISRGVKGEFELYAIHYGLLADANAVVVGKAKNISKFNNAFSHRNAHSFTRTTPKVLAQGKEISKVCSISLPNCPKCGKARINEELKFCGYCGYQLTEPSIFLEIIDKDISHLPITTHRSNKIKELSSIRTIKDILIDNEHKELRSVDRIGPHWADKIYTMAEEYIS